MGPSQEFLSGVGCEEKALRWPEVMKMLLAYVRKSGGVTGSQHVVRSSPSGSPPLASKVPWPAAHVWHVPRWESTFLASGSRTARILGLDADIFRP
eukprot:5018062-Pyramimonas_sp.AAC.1